MKKTPIDVIEHAGLIMAALKKGILITSAKDGKVNSMTISWGALGIEWNKNIFTTYVRESRFTRTFIEETGEFTVNLPIGAFDPQITKICGSKSGRDCDKIKELNLHPVVGDEVQAPGLLELPLTLECRVVMKSYKTQWPWLLIALNGTQKMKVVVKQTAILLIMLKYCAPTSLKTINFQKN